MTLYLKYRPKNLDEIDSVEVSESLKKIVSSGSIPHAFLFVGPKGTGKTSAARILAKIINCEEVLKGKNLKVKSYEPCDKCDQCVATSKGVNLDVIEMDAASNRGIDDVRNLRDAVKLAPAAGSKKIYIIDEAHMLTAEASNALLKTLEEPPEHVVFILATTNPEKIIDTIKSRTTVIAFKKAKIEELVKALTRVCIGESLKISKESLELIAKAADGAFRDAIKILEQILSEGVVLETKALDDFLFSKGLFNLDFFVELLVKKDAKNLLKQIAELESKGINVQNFLDALMSFLREALLQKVGLGGKEIKELDKRELIYLLELLNQTYRDMQDSPIEELPLEVAIIKWCQDDGANEARSGKQEEGGREKGEMSIKKEEMEGTKVDNVEVVGVSSTVLENVNDEIWKTILNLVKPVNASIEALLRAAKPIAYDGKTLTLGVYYKFHKERLEDGHHRRVLEEIVAKVLHSPTRVVCTLTEPSPRKIVEEAKLDAVLTEGKDTDIIKAAEEIFGN